MGINFRDVQSMDDSFSGLSNTLLRNRMMNAEQQRYDQEQQRLQQSGQAEAKYRADDLDVRNGMLNEQMKRDNWAQDPTNPLNKQREGMADNDEAKADIAGQPTFTWTSGGAKQTVHSQEDFMAGVKDHPIDTDPKGKHTVTMSGTNADGNTIHLPVTIDVNSPTAKQDAVNALDFFNKTLGVVPKPAKTGTETDTTTIKPEFQKGTNNPMLSTNALTGAVSPLMETNTTKRVTRPLPANPTLNIGDSGLPNLAPDVPIASPQQPPDPLLGKDRKHPIKPKTKEDAAKLKKGTFFQDPIGLIWVK